MNAFATPNGIVVVNSGLIEMLENEAQLAAVVGHEIAHATHEHTWRQQQYPQEKADRNRDCRSGRERVRDA